MNQTVSHNDPAPAQAPPKRRASNAVGAKASARRRVRVAEGIYRDRHGLAATVKVNGVQREMRFPPGTPLKTMRARRDELRPSLRAVPAGERSTLAHDAARYLKQVGGELLSIADRRHHINLWTPCFGDVRTLELPQHTAAINDQLRQWRATRSASACNHRRDALTNLVKTLYGRRAAAEFVDLVRFAAPPPKPRWIDRTHIAEVLAQLTPGSKTVVRLRLMRWTGMPPSQMARLQPEDLRLDEPTPFVVVPRGKGGRLAAIPLVGEGLKVAREFTVAGAYGRWSCQCEQATGTGGPESRASFLHRVSDSPFVRDGASADGIGRGGHPGPVRPHGPRDDYDLRPAAVAETRRYDRAFAARGPGASTTPTADSPGRNGCKCNVDIGRPVTRLTPLRGAPDFSDHQYSEHQVTPSGAAAHLTPRDRHYFHCRVWADAAVPGRHAGTPMRRLALYRYAVDRVTRSRPALSPASRTAIERRHQREKAVLVSSTCTPAP